MGKNIEKTNSLEKALELVGKKHDLLILDALLKTNRRAGFNQILKAVPTLNPRMLSLRLKKMESDKLLTKALILGTPVKTEYALTPKSEELIEIIEKLKAWAEKH
ncbi:MAG: helix-turn-helix domain-containing protein [Candidatus Diapherotrites archaeon]|nr:helix-turn-helix domain-containing protein [Candidatus Diapherotrites archaeon]